jgi:peptidoglycan/LPS O-acetylase OafA/YrhL
MLARGFSTLKAAMGAAVGAAFLIVLRDFLGFAQIHDFSFDALLIGCCAGLFFTSRHRQRLARLCSYPVVAAGALTLVVFFLFKPPVLTVALGSRRLSLAHIAMELSVAIVLVWLVEGAVGLRVLHAVLASPPFRYTGRISYALYLWHSTVLAAMLWHGVTDETAARIAAVFGSFAIATISYYVVEQPFLRRKWRLARTESHDRSLEAITMPSQPTPASNPGAA